VSRREGRGLESQRHAGRMGFILPPSHLAAGCRTDDLRRADERETRGPSAAERTYYSWLRIESEERNGSEHPADVKATTAGGPPSVRLRGHARALVGDLRRYGESTQSSRCCAEGGRGRCLSLVRPLSWHVSWSRRQQGR
jgi:hypothetical protein